MIEDPGEDPDRVPPYAALAPVGVTPRTTHAEMQDVSFELQARRLMTRQTQQAWNDLRNVRRRLLLDLFLYDLGGDGPDGAGHGGDRHGQLGQMAFDGVRDGADDRDDGDDGEGGPGQGAVPEDASAPPGGASEEAGGQVRPVGTPPPWAARLLDDLIRFDR
ncbi:hypothetical protein GCM10027074_41110 [Streptomyces deserti]